MSEHWPETWEELIDRFAKPAIHAGSPPEGHPPSHDYQTLVDWVALVRIVNPTLTPDDLCNKIYDHHLMYERGQFGWIDRQGKWLTCSYAYHEALLKMMGVTCREAEDSGWLRVSLHGCQILYRPSPKQLRKLHEMGKELRDPPHMYPMWEDPEQKKESP